MCQNGKENSLEAKERVADSSLVPSNDDKAVFCRYCYETISSRARVCHHCQKPQVWWRAPPLELAGPLGIVIALGLLILGALQYRDAKEEKVAAAEALRRASKASEQAIAASKLASNAEQALNEQRIEINNNAQHLFSELCEVGGGKFNHSTFFCQLPDGRELKYESVFQKDLSLPVK
jgi:hypothetical protein